MYFVPDGTMICGFYACSSCDMRFLDTKIASRLTCPYCGQEPDMEIGPDDDMPVNQETATLVEVVEGEEEVARYDTLLSCAFSGDDDSWL